MKALRRVAGFLVVLSLLTSCATASPEAPPGGPKAEMGFPPPGTKFVVRTTEHTGSTNTRTFTVLDESTYAGRPALRISDGTDTLLYDKATRSWTATFQGGQERFTATPHSGEGSPVLWVGKWWAASYTYDDRVRGRSFSPVQSTWKVEAYEDVTVPAGTFKAFRVSSSPGLNEALYITYWYAPDVKLVVKRISERRSDHYLGPGKFVNELMEYSRK